LKVAGFGLEGGTRIERMALPTRMMRIFSCNPDTYLEQGRKGWNAGESDGFANADF
jgi:hypothetical protein